MSFPSVRSPCPIFALLGTVWLLCGGCQSSDAPPQATASPAALRETHLPRLQDAKTSFYEAVEGRRDSLARARQTLDQLGGARSSDPQVVAYLGACELLQAAHAVFPWDQAGLARQGLALGDRALAMAPDDLEVRFLRGVTNYPLPGFLGRTQLCESDLSRVAQVAEREASTGRLDVRAAAADLDYYGKIRERHADLAGALAAWRSALRVDADSPGGRDAAKHLVEHHAFQ